MQEFRLPKLGSTMEDAAIVACRVKVGDEVRPGDILFDIETDKAAMELESPAAAFVKSVLVQPGQTVPVGEILLILGSKDEVISQHYDAAAAVGLAAAQIPEGGQHISLGQRPGSAASLEPRLGQRIPITHLQKIIAAQMLRSKREIPCFYLNIRADVTDLVAFRQRLNESSGTKIAFSDLIIHAMARALRQFPTMTGQLTGDYIQLAGSIGVGLAIAVPDGLVAPVVKDADKKDLAAIAGATRALAARAKSGKLAAADFEGGCITLSNLGPLGVESFIPIVVPGQCSILGAGKITDTCAPGSSGPAIRKMMSMTLAVDHKVANGAYAAQFLEHIKKLLEDPASFS